MAIKEALSETQKQIANLYYEDPVPAIESMEQVDERGDALLQFLVRISGDAETLEDAVGLIDSAKERLETISEDLWDRIGSNEHPTP